ncbi:unnamed protein product [Lathyrus sativus]|nr:unnamed protein product [Lathyrus sativus]
MNITSINIRGCGTAIKRKRVRYLVEKGKVYLIFIQETKTQKMSKAIVRNMWEPIDVSWSALDACGHSGGIITIWKHGIIDSILSFRENGFIGIEAIHKCNTIFFLNIYSSCQLVEKRRTWTKIVEWKNRLEVGEWIIGGDFNSVKHRNERIRCSVRSYRYEIEDFVFFIDLMEVVDLPIVGN